MITDDQARVVAARNGLSVERVRRMPSVGFINEVYALDDRYVLRVPKDHPAHIEQARVEAQAIPLAVAAGVRTPRLLAFDDSLDVVPVPVLVVELAEGRDLESTRSMPDAVFVELGRDLARLHTEVAVESWPRDAVVPTVDLHPLVEDRVADGWFSWVEAEWLHAWLDRLGPFEPGLRSAAHGDVQLANVLADGDRYTALLDWGCAARKDPAIDFMPLPMGCVPAMLRGYRECTPADGIERRILLGRLRALLTYLPGGPALRSWGDRPTAWFADVLRFFQRPPTAEWRELAPR